MCTHARMHARSTHASHPQHWLSLPTNLSRLVVKIRPINQF